MDSDILVAVILVLNLIGVLGFGIAIEHWFLTLVGYIIALAVIGGISENVLGIFVIAVSVITLIAIIRQFVIKGNRNKLLKAVKNGDIDTARKLVSKGVDVAYFYYNKENPLSIAIENNDKAMVSILLDKIYDLNYNPENPLVIATQKGFKEIVSLLIDKGANVNYGDRNLLYIAVKNNDKEMVSTLVQKGADINKLYEGKPPLDYAKNEEVIALLKSYGAKTKKEIDEDAKVAFIVGTKFDDLKDYEKAVEYYEKAIKLGNVDACYNMATIYLNGLGVEKDYYKVFEFSKVAAEAGIVDSQVTLGWCYYNGYGTYKDESEAFYWWEKAAEQGNAVAMYDLGLYYERRFSYVNAGDWYKKSALLGDKDAFKKLKDLCSRGLYYVNM